MKKLLLTSILSVVMCISLIAGATFALFTSESKVNIAVSSGTVKVTATIDDTVKTGSTLGTADASFKAQVDGANVNLEGMVPGDYAEFTVKIVNGSDVDTVSRTIVQPVADNGLLAGLKISIDGDDFVGYAVTDWSHDLTEKEVKIKIELPKEAGNVYQGKACKLLFKVEMEQGNSPAIYDGLKTDDNGNVLITNENDWRYFSAMTNSGISTFANTQLNVVLTNDIDFNGAAILPVGVKGASFNGHFDGQGNTLKNATIVGSDFVALFGLVANGNYIENVKIDNFTISGNHYVGGILGYGYAGVKNCTVTNSTITAIPELTADGQTYDNGDKVGGIAGWTDNHEISGNTVKDTVLMGYRDIGGIAGCVIPENNDVKVINNAVSGVTVKYYTEISADKMVGNNTNKNANAIVGRIGGGKEVIIENSDISDTVTPAGSSVASVEKLEAALEVGGTIEIERDIAFEGGMVINEDVATTLTFNGAKVSGNTDKTEKGVIYNAGELTIENGNIASTADNGGSALYNAGVMTVNGGSYTGAPRTGTSWPSYVVNNNGEMTISNATFTSTHGALAVNSGSKMIVNNVNVAMNGFGGSSHVFYVGGELIVNGGKYIHNGNVDGSLMYMYNGADVVINGGYFEAVAGKGGYGIASLAGSSLVVNGGTFKNAFLNWGGDIKVNGGTFYFNPKAYIDSTTHTVLDKDGVYVVVSKQGTENKTLQTVAPSAGAEKLEFSNINDYTTKTDSNTPEDVYIFVDQDVVSNETVSNSYGKTGLNVNGATIDMNGNDIDAKGANGTWDSAINITAGTIKNANVVGGFRGIFINHNGVGGKVYLENVIVDGPTYTISCDQGTNSGLEATNCTFKGWTSYAATIGDVKFTNCIFGAGAGYNFSRPYAPTEYVGCDFEAGHLMDPRAAVTFENCTIDGVPLTAENIGNLVYQNMQNVTVK